MNNFKRMKTIRMMTFWKWFTLLFIAFKWASIIHCSWWWILIPIAIEQLAIQTHLKLIQKDIDTESITR